VRFGVFFIRCFPRIILGHSGGNSYLHFYLKHGRSEAIGWLKIGNLLKYGRWIFHFLASLSEPGGGVAVLEFALVYLSELIRKERYDLTSRGCCRAGGGWNVRSHALNGFSGDWCC